MKTETADKLKAEMEAKSKPTPTPTPWKINEIQTRLGGWRIDAELSGRKGGLIGIADLWAQGNEPDDEMKANAALIVRAVNAHEKLLQIAKTFQRHLANQKGHNCYKLCDDIAQALAQAEGK